MSDLLNRITTAQIEAGERAVMEDLKEKLGADVLAAVYEAAPPETCAQVDDSLGLQMISIRLQKQLIEEMKLIAEYYGKGYQPLMREVLEKWARTELSVIVHDLKRQLSESEEG